MVPLQQPFGHELALHRHAPPEHTWPELQAPQVAPAVPQELLDCEE